MDWFSKKKEEAEEKIKVDSGYDIFSESNVGNIATSLSNMSALIGDYKEPDHFFNKENDKKKSWNGYDYYTLNNENTLNFIGVNEGKFGNEFKTYFSNLAEYSKINGIKASKGLTAFGKKAEDITNSIVNAFTHKEEATFTAANKNNDVVNGSNELFKPDNGKYFTEVEKTVQQNIINQNLSAFKGEENAPKTVKIKGTEFSPQEIAEAMGGGKSLNDFIGEKDELFKQSGKEDKSEDEKNADIIRGKLSAGLELLNKYTTLSNEYLKAENKEEEKGKLKALLNFCTNGGKEEGNELDIKYFEKYDKSRNYNTGENFFVDLENLRKLEQKIQQERERQEREKQEKQRQQQLLNQAKVDAYNKLYNGIEKNETSPAKSFDGTDFRDDKNDIVNLNESNTGFDNVDNPVNTIKNYVVSNIKGAKDLEELNKQKDEIGATITLCSNQKTLGENKKSFDSKFIEVQEKLDKTKQTVQDNFDNFNNSIGEKSEKEVDNIEVKTSNEAQSKIDELNKKREELIKKVKQEKEAFDKSVEDTKNDNTGKKEKIENDIGNIGKDFDKTNITKDSINELASEIKSKAEDIAWTPLESEIKTPDFNKDLEEIQKLNKQIENLGKTKDDLKIQEDLNQAKVDAYNKLYNGVEGKKIDPAKSFDGENFYKDETNTEQTKIEDVELGLKSERLNKYNDIVQNSIKQLEVNIKNSKSIDELEKNNESISVVEELCNNAREVNEAEINFENRYKVAKKTLDEANEKIQQNLDIILEINGNLKKSTKADIDIGEVGDITGKTEDSIDKEIKDLEIKKNEIYDNFVKTNNDFYNEYLKKDGKNKKIKKEKDDIINNLNSTTEKDLKNLNDKTKTGAEDINKKEFETMDVTKIPDFEEFKRNMEDIDKEIARLEKQKELVQERDINLNQAKVEARNDLVKRINPAAEMASNFHNGEFYKGDEIKDENKLSTDKSNVGINNTDNALNCIIEQNIENIAKSEKKEEVEEFKKNNEYIGEFYNKTVELKKEENKFYERHTKAQENLKQISDTVDKNLKSFNEFCDNSKKEVENSTKEINETESGIVKTEAEANKRIEELEEERKRLIEEFNEASEKSKKEIEEKQSSNDRTKEGTEMYVKSIGDGVSKEKSLQENLESLKKDNIDDKIEMTKAKFLEDQEIPNFEDYKNRINEIDQHLAGLEKIKENLKQQEQQNQEEQQEQEIDQPVSRDVQQLEPKTDINGLRLKFFNGFNKLVDKNAEEATLVEVSDDKESISYANDNGNVGLKEIEGKNRLKGFAENINKLMGKDKFLFSNSDNDRGQEYTQEKIEENLKNTETTLKNKEEAETIESNFDKIKDEVEGYKKRFDEKFEDIYKKIVKVDINENIYDNLSSPEEINKQKEELTKQKEELEKRYNEYKEKINEKSEEINEKETNLEKNVKDIEEYTDPESINPLLNSEHTQELSELLENFKKTSEVEGLNTEELKKFEVDMAEIKAKEELLSKVEEKINQKQQDTAELNLDAEVKTIAGTKENSKDELIENNAKLEDKCEQIYKQKGIENDKEKQYDVKCEELQKSINKLSDDQKKQYSERMEELIGHSLDMSVPKEKREKIDIDLCEKQRLYITETKNCDGKVADNIKDAGVGVKVTDLSENYRRTVGQKSIGLVATVEDIDPKKFYEDGEVPGDVNKFNFTRFEVQSIAEDEKDEYKGYKIDLKLPKKENTVDIMADIRELGFEKAMEKYKDAGLEVNVRDKNGKLLSNEKGKNGEKSELEQFFEKLQSKSAEESIGLEEQKQKMNNESLSKKEREEARKEFEEIMKRVEEREKKDRSMDDTGIKPTIQANKEDSLPKMPDDISKTLPSGSNFRVPSKNNNKNGEQNMSETENKNNLTKDQKTIQKKLDDNGLHKNDVSNVNNFDPKTPLPTSQTISAGQGHGQNTNQNVNLA